MKNPKDLLVEELTTSTLVELTSAFEGIASNHLAKIKNQVLEAGDFFEELWKIYNQLRVDKVFHFGRGKSDKVINNKVLYMLITNEGGFSGDLDEKLTKLMMSSYDPNKHDLVVIGHHGVMQLMEKGVAIKKYFRMPARDQNINVEPLVREVVQYKTTQVFYAKYISLTNQEVKNMLLSSAVQERGAGIKITDDIISDVTYIFEPSVYAVVDHLERSMLGIELSQLLLDAKLAQYAARFKAMSAARQNAEEAQHDVHLAYRRALRAVKDERLKEIITSIRIAEKKK